MKGTTTADKARNADALRDAIASGILADDDERQREQEEADAREEEELRAWWRRWHAEEASQDCL